METPFEDIPGAQRDLRLNRAQAASDWAAAQGPLGGVILHLRHRAAATRCTALLFLGMLVVAIVIGLAFYLGLPFWQTWADGRREALQETLDRIEIQKAALDRDRRAQLVGGELQNGKSMAQGLPALLRAGLASIPTGIATQLQGVIVHGGRLFIFGEQGTVLRLKADGMGFDLLPTGTTVNLRKAKLHGGQLFIFGEAGVVIRLSPDGSRLETVPTHAKVDFTDTVIYDDRLFLLDGTNAVQRLTADGSRFEVVPTGANANIWSAIVNANRLFVFGQHGNVHRLTTDGTQFELVPTFSSTDLQGAIVHSDRLFVFGKSGMVGRLTADGARFERLPTNGNADLWKAVSIGDRLILLGNVGVTFRFLPDGTRFEAMPTSATFVARGTAIHNDRLFLFGLDGTIHRLNPDGTLFEEVPIRKNAGIWDAITHEGKLFVFGLGGNVSQLATDGTWFEGIPTGTEANLWRAIVYDNRMFLVGENGQVLASATTLADIAIKLPVDAGQTGLGAVEAFFDEILPAHLRDWDPIQTLRNELRLVESERAGLSLIQLRAQTDMSDLIESPLQYLRDRKALDFKGFLDGCRGEAATADITTACLTAWQSEQAAGQRSWWETLADQLPPGILLLFLLANLGGLYRYNLRLAGFHESRADALQLLAHGRDEIQLRDILAGTPGDAVNLATLFLAADKVEMGAIRAKLGQAEIELAKAMNSSE